MSKYDVFLSTNSEPSRTDHVGTVDADNAEQALIEAQGQHECPQTCHLWVAIQTTECAYCSSEIPADQSEIVPDIDDDDSWANLELSHAKECEWIATRAHRRNCP